MKKVFSVFVLVTLLSVLVFPQMSLAAAGQPTKCTISTNNVSRLNAALGLTTDAPCVASCIFDEQATGYVEATHRNCAACCLMNTVYNITDWIFFILVAIAAIMVLLGGFNLLFAGGSPEKVDTAQVEVARSDDRRQ